MSLLNGARDLANRAGQVCTVWHIFQAALPPNLYIEEPAKRILETAVQYPTRSNWASALQPQLQRVPRAVYSGQESQEFTAAINAAQARANVLGRAVTDDIVLATILDRENTIQSIVQAAGVDYSSLIRQLDPQPIVNPVPPLPNNPPALSQSQIAAKEAEQEAERAKKVLEDLLDIAKTSGDSRYVNFQAVDINTFMTTLAESVDDRNLVVCMGQNGSLIEVLEILMSDHLADQTAFTGVLAPLHGHSAKLYKLNMENLVSLLGKAGAPKPASVLKAAREKLMAMPEKPILMLDHVETIRGNTKEMEDLRFELENHSRLLMFAIYHAADQDEPVRNARLELEHVKALYFGAYDAAQTKQLIDQFYKHLWGKQGPSKGYAFTKDAFDLLIALEPGTWHDQVRKVLPFLAIDVTEDALRTAARGDAALRETVACAQQAFRDLGDELTRTPERAKYEPLIRRAEEEVRHLVTPTAGGGLLGFISNPRVPRVDPNKPKMITSGHLVAELICRNRSEFHYPPFKPKGI
jgi:hypothetical protein